MQWLEKLDKKRKRLMIGVLLPLLIMVWTLPSGAFYRSEGSAEGKVPIATWKYKVTTNMNGQLVINLLDTMTPNEYSNDTIIPGTNGRIRLEFDFSEMKVAVDYRIFINRVTSNLPSNIKLFKDAAMTVAADEITGSVPLEQMNSPVLIDVYWKWVYTTEDETQAWSNKDIQMDLTLEVSQKIG